MACVSASMPLSAVTFGGHDTVKFGSTSATAGRRRLLTILALRWLSVSVKTAAADTSEPVPAVVGTPQQGQHRAVDLVLRRSSRLAFLPEPGRGL